MMQQLRHLALSLLLAAGAAPASAQIAVLSEGILERATVPGGSYQGTIRVKNTSAVPQEVRAYLTDYQFDASGESTYGEPGSVQRSNARWIHLSSERLVIGPDAEAQIAYTVTVPAGAPLAGSYWSMVMVEAVVPLPPPTSGPRQMALRTAVRHGVQVVSHLPGGTSEARFANVQVVPTPGGPHALQFDVVNAGELAWRVKLTLELYDDDGLMVKRLVQQRGMLYAGTALRQPIPLEGLAPGTYRALLLADTGGEQLFGTQFRLTVPTR